MVVRMGLGWMIGEGSGEVDLKMDLNLLASVRRRGDGEDGVDTPDGGVSRDLHVLGGDRVLDLECLENGFTNLVRCGGDRGVGGSDARASTWSR